MRLAQDCPQESIELEPISHTVYPLLRKGRMKFSEGLVFNAAPELQGHYIAYDNLKQAIYRLERQSYSANEANTDLESAQLLSAHDSPSVKIFSALLDKELDNISKFYKGKEEELLASVAQIAQDIEAVERGDFAQDWEAGSDDEDDADSVDSQREANTLSSRRASKLFSNVFNTPSSRRSRAKSNASKKARTSSFLSRDRQNGILEVDEGQNDNLDYLATPSVDDHKTNRHQAGDEIVASKRARRKMSVSTTGEGTVWSASSEWAIDTRISFKLRLQDLFRELTQLKQFITLNQTGFRKIIKKFDKTTDSDLQKDYMSNVVSKAYPFVSETKDKLDQALDTVIQHYTRILAHGDRKVAVDQLKAQLREFIVFERNTVWRDMVGMHARGVSKQGAGSKPILQDVDELKRVDDPTELTIVARLRGVLFTRQGLGAIFGLTTFVILLNLRFMQQPEEQNCLALLALASIFWAVEVVPLFVTSLSVPLLVIVLRVVKSQDGLDRRLTAPETTKYIFAQMFSPTIMLLVGGFTLAAALSKHNIDKMLATRVLSLAGTSPRAVLMAYMGVACFASMWISNVAAPVLCYSLIQPVLRSLPPRTTFSRALILGIALASNVGGQSSPISSPQNLIALEYMNPQLSWLQWFAIALPVSAVSVVLIGLLLMWSYAWEPSLSIAPVRQSRDTFTIKQYAVSAVAIVTILLWCFSHQIDSVFGDMGVIAIIPIICFYGTGLLRKNDFESYPWAIVFLAMGGISLGKAVLSSGLLDDIDTVIQNAVHGLDIWLILALSSVVCLIIATFVSHTVASVLLVPVAAQIGAAMEQPHPRLLIMSTALICSAGMGLPVSGFPNMTAINLESDMGQTYLQVNDFLRNGIPASLIATTVVITLGYLLMRLLGL